MRLACPLSGSWKCRQIDWYGRRAADQSRSAGVCCLQRKRRGVSGKLEIAFPAGRADRSLPIDRQAGGAAVELLILEPRRQREAAFAFRQAQRQHLFDGIERICPSRAPAPHGGEGDVAGRKAGDAVVRTAQRASGPDRSVDAIADRGAARGV